MKISLIPALADNYIYLIEEDDGTVAVVDPAAAAPVIETLSQRGLGLDLILNTHHHGDHIAGNAELKRRYGARIIAAAADRHRIDGMDDGVADGDVVTVGASRARVIATPGHTTGHICFYFEDAQALFCGDTLFSLGCGRLLEGTAAQMWDSLRRLSALPGETGIYCGHEYTLANAAFCRTVEPDNEDLARLTARAQNLRARNLPTLPVTLADEISANAFLRAGSAARFAELRLQKDVFKT